MNEFSKEIETIMVVGLYGEPYEYSNVDDALAGIDGIALASKEAGIPLDGIRVTVSYRNDEAIHGYFKSNAKTKLFLERFAA